VKFYNTLTRKVEDFVPEDPSRVRMYVCGPTVYDYAHIGNFRPMVVFDSLNRLLRHKYGQDAVVYARNITDIDDKIINQAIATETTIDVITDRTIAAFHDDLDALNVAAPDHEPRCTEYVEPMVAMIEELIEGGFAYAAEGHALFDIHSYEKYGKLSKRSLDDMRAGARVEVAPYKRDPGDFVLWKPSTDEQPGWPSPWGRGRPGWHIECSAMSKSCLGETFDIHGGGLDLIFPHHENEIAQSCCANGTEVMARHWMHNGYLTVEGEKMSKSLGNFFTVKQLRDEGWGGEVIRFSLLSAHYRQPLDFSRDKMREMKAQLDRWYGFLKESGDPEAGEVDERVIAALSDDLNTPQAIAILHELTDRPADLKASATMLGLLQQDSESWFKGEVSDDENAEIEALIEKRKQAKADKDFATADQVRDQLTSMGIVLEDKSGGVTEWKRG
jgi:cysteinyl-tRNA synthetase